MFFRPISRCDAFEIGGWAWFTWRHMKCTDRCLAPGDSFGTVHLDSLKQGLGALDHFFLILRLNAIDDLD